MKILTCLGNPGKKYSSTRHNIGFIIGDYLASEMNISLKKKEFSSLCGQGKLDGADILIIQPQTYMNESGTAVQKAMTYHKLDPDDLIVIHDEIELSFGEIRTKFGGGHKGHNGLRSIIKHISSPDFYRIRFGVGRPDHPEYSVADYVLSSFNKEETSSLKDRLPHVKETIISILNS